jgi:hypothetical protein
MSLPLAQSGHQTVARRCPLLGVKRTSRLIGAMSAFDPKRTLAFAHGLSGTEIMLDNFGAKPLKLNSTKCEWWAREAPHKPTRSVTCLKGGDQKGSLKPLSFLTRNHYPVRQ